MKRALISVSDKTGIVSFAKALCELGFEIISTGGTLKVLQDNRIQATAIDAVTGFPEILDGRVKTLHPAIHAGLLAVRDNVHHMATCQEHGIGLIDLVVVNLYPFEKTVSAPNVHIEDAIENIDIGGPSMLRSASKNYRSVGVIVCPSRYPEVLHHLSTSLTLPETFKAQLAQEAFAHTARYDSLIASFFAQKIIAKDTSPFAPTLSPILEKVSELRYGENPHQPAAFYRLAHTNGLGNMVQHHGKELSYNNIVDMEAAWHIVRSMDLPASAIIKHTNPCGVATGSTLHQAYASAYQADSVSAFGSIVGLNRPVDLQTAKEISATFVEVVIAPSFEEDALALLSQKANIRLVSIPCFDAESDFTFKHVTGGFLVQTPDTHTPTPKTFHTVTTTQPTKSQLHDLAFAMTVAKYVKSNAVLIAKNGVTLGIGAGQMSRVEATEIALKKAGASAKGAVMASDAFFPFKDSVELAQKAGITAIIHPGGSKRDQESIDVCNHAGIAMVTTGIRHFKH